MGEQRSSCSLESSLRLFSLAPAAACTSLRFVFFVVSYPMPHGRKSSISLRSARFTVKSFHPSQQDHIMIMCAVSCTTLTLSDSAATAATSDISVTGDVKRKVKT